MGSIWLFLVCYINLNTYVDKGYTVRQITRTVNEGTINKERKH